MLQGSVYLSYLMGRNVATAKRVQGFVIRRNFRTAVLLHGCDVFDGTEGKWRDWKVVGATYYGLVAPGLAPLLA